jgi:hypothetical protein
MTSHRVIGYRSDRNVVLSSVDATLVLTLPLSKEMARNLQELWEWMTSVLRMLEFKMPKVAP